MASYRELLQRVKLEIDELGAVQARERHPATGGTALFLDVREQDEWDEGAVPGAVHVPRGNLEQRIEGLVPDRSREIVVYCAGGSRSAFAAKTLAELGYENVLNLAGGFTDWKRNGFESRSRETLTPEQRARYSRHLLIPEVGEAGQQRLLQSRVLLIGAGGLGSPASLYLAAAGVGTLGIVDADVVDDSNLQRQIVHSTERLGEPKVASAKRTLEALNPDVDVEDLRGAADVGERRADPRRGLGRDHRRRRQLPHALPRQRRVRLARDPRRARLDLPLRGPGHRLRAARGPCYRCLFPTPPPPELAPSCAEGGVLGVLPGIIGSLQANEALKLLLGAGETLRGRLAALRRPREHVRRGDGQARSRLPRLRRAPDDHGVRRLCRVLPGGSRVTAVRIPPTLRAEVAGERQVEAHGGTVREVLEDLARRYPALEPQLFDDGDIAPFVNVYVGGEDVRTLEGLETRVDGLPMILLPAMAGGR